jgi:hypothetical protein
MATTTQLNQINPFKSKYKIAILKSALQKWWKFFFMYYTMFGICNRNMKLVATLWKLKKNMIMMKSIL